MRDIEQNMNRTKETRNDMKIKITEIEANAEEIRQSNTLADGLTRMFRNAFNPYYSTQNYTDENDESEEEQ